jgi:hypothetical protein
MKWNEKYRGMGTLCALIFQKKIDVLQKLKLNLSIFGCRIPWDTI